MALVRIASCGPATAGAFSVIRHFGACTQCGYYTNVSTWEPGQASTPQHHAFFAALSGGMRRFGDET